MVRRERPMNVAKRSILYLLNRAGYHLVKHAAYENLLSSAAHAGRTEPPAPAPARDGALGGVAAASGDADLARFLGCLGSHAEVPLPRTLALYAAVRHLTQAGIPGDIVDCGYGTTSTLTLIAVALLHFDDPGRRLVLFDTTADPLHRADTELELWGTDRDLLATGARSPRRQTVEPAPAPLVATGYPVDRIAVKRYPRDPIAHAEPIAFLALTSATYDSNRAAIAAFLPRVSPGGVIAVETDPLARTRRDAVDEFLRQDGVNLLLVPVTPTYRLGARP
jgi:hypothetical protein